MKKTYTFTNNKNNTFNTPSNESSNSAYINALIRTNLRKVCPYADVYTDTITHPTTITTTRKPKTTVIDITVSKPKQKKRAINFDDYSAFRKAVEYFTNSYDDIDTYDFMIGNIPVKIFNDGEIQIGYELFNLNSIDEDYFSTLNPKTKKTIIDIYISLNK